MKTAEHAATVRKAEHAATVKAAEHAATVTKAEHAATVKTTEHAATVKTTEHAATRWDRTSTSRRASSAARSPRRIVAVLCLVQFVDVLGVTELIGAMPRILSSLSAPSSAASLLLTAYAMCFGGLLMAGARIGDRVGHRRTLLAGIGVFVAGSLLAAGAWSMPVLIAGRTLQGVSAALSVPAALRLLVAATPRPSARRRAMSAWSATGATAGASGLLLGGALTELAGWRAMFWINVPLALLIVAAIPPNAAEHPRETGRDIDMPGALLFTATVMSLVLAASELERPGRITLGLLIATGAGVLAAALVWVERRAPNPILPAAALRDLHLRAGARAAFLNTATTSPPIALAALWLQDTQGLNPAAAGLRLVPFSLCVIGGSGLAAPVLSRRRAGTVIALGLGVIGTGDVLLIALHAGWWLSIGVGLAGAGIGLSSVAATALGTDVEPALQGTAAGALNTSAQLGTALGVAALLLLASVTSPHGGSPVSGTMLAWGTAGAVAFAGAGLTLAGNRL